MKPPNNLAQNYKDDEAFTQMAHQMEYERQEASKRQENLLSGRKWNSFGKTKQCNKVPSQIKMNKSRRRNNNRGR
jgi:hypothetical protein